MVMVMVDVMVDVMDGGWGMRDAECIARCDDNGNGHAPSSCDIYRPYPRIEI